MNNEKGRLTVEVSVFNRTTPVELSFDEVKKKPGVTMAKKVKGCC